MILHIYVLSYSYIFFYLFNWKTHSISFLIFSSFLSEIKCEWKKKETKLDPAINRSVHNSMCLCGWASMWKAASLRDRKALSLNIIWPHPLHSQKKGLRSLALEENAHLPLWPHFNVPVLVKTQHAVAMYTGMGRTWTTWGEV